MCGSTSSIRRCRRRTRLWIDLFGLVFFLMPVHVHAGLDVVAATSCTSCRRGEISSNAWRPDPLAGQAPPARRLRAAWRCRACRRSSSASPRCRAATSSRPSTKSRCSRSTSHDDGATPSLLDLMPPLMFGGLLAVHAARFSGGLLARRRRPVLRHDRRWSSAISTASFMHALPFRVLRHPVQRPAAGHSVLHLHGRHPRALRPGRGSARRHRPAVRLGARRPRLCGDHRRRDPWRDHRHGRGLGHRHGHHLAADHAALRLRHDASPPA